MHPSNQTLLNDLGVPSLSTSLSQVSSSLSGTTSSTTSLSAAVSSSLSGTTSSTASLSAAVSSSLSSTAALVPNASYRSLLDCTASHIAGRVAGTYWFGQGQPAGITGVGTLHSPNLIYINSADYPTLNGIAPKLRIRAQIYVNDVAPTGNFTLGLYPVTRPATAGGAGLNIYALGTVVPGSTVAQNTPAADSMNVLVGADFILPANGHYVLGMVTTTTVAALSHLHISPILQMRNA